MKKLWPEINDKMPQASSMELVAMAGSAAANRACFNNLDQVATSLTLLDALDPASLTNGKQLAA